MGDILEFDLALPEMQHIWGRENSKNLLDCDSKKGQLLVKSEDILHISACDVLVMTIRVCGIVF